MSRSPKSPTSMAWERSIRSIATTKSGPSPSAPSTRPCRPGRCLRACSQILDEMDFPPGHYWETRRRARGFGRRAGQAYSWFPPCFLLIIALLIWQFNSFRRAGIIVITIPLILIGAVVGMLVMRADFGFMVILGLLSLAGTIINNGIVLIDKNRDKPVGRE